MFNLTDDEKLRIDKWRRKHKCKVRVATIGGRLTYCFTPTGIGVLAKVKCSCGKKIHLRDSKDW